MPRARGFVGYAGIEPEFIVMRWQDGQPVKAFDNDPLPGGGVRPRRQAFGYDIEYTVDSMGFLSAVIEILENLGWGLKDVVCEGAYSQFELDFGYTDLLGMADRLVFLRVLLKEVAKKQGLFVTYMPKPTTGDWRSGAHINYSMQRVDAPGKNLFGGSRRRLVGRRVPRRRRTAAPWWCASPPSPARRSTHTTAWCRAWAASRAAPVTWAPTHMTYGNNNRSAMLRLPQNRFCVENRASDLCMNPYLALAMTSAAAVAGVTQGIDPGPPLNKDLYDLTDEEIRASGGQRLPRNLLEATEILKDDLLAAEVLGPTMLNSWLRYKVDEWERYHQAVTDWEVQEYLRLY